MKKLALHLFTLATAALGFTTLGASHARAQANLSFSGGLGAPLTLTLNAPITYLVTSNATQGGSPDFVLQGLGNLFGGVGSSVTSTITFTTLRGSTQTTSNVVNFLGSGYGGNSIASNDAYLIVLPHPGVQIGDTVTLNAGTVTTTANFNGASPANGAYQTFLTDDFGNRMTALNGVAGAVPEPSTWAAVALGAAGLGVVTYRRRAVPAA